ncbi:uncharacterized protein METZ01_LOCUS13900 [marine metagenome]|uniref:Uncharacterized protein n=1 Tax=marine metagenome TaxID=408172 RepID=A0A381P268_9ZZZZ
MADFWQPVPLWTIPSTACLMSLTSPNEVIRDSLDLVRGTANTVFSVATK